MIMTMENLKYQTAEYQRKINQLRMLRFDLDKQTIVNEVQKINQLRMLRFDLDEQTIINEVQKIASKYPISFITVLLESIELAMSGEPMQWEDSITS